MAETMYCKYCGCRITNLSGMCNPCTEKLRLIRKIRRIVQAIKRDAERERELKEKQESNIPATGGEWKNGQTGNHSDTQTIQRIAS